jgi:hypothetical protein
MPFPISKVVTGVSLSVPDCFAASVSCVRKSWWYAGNSALAMNILEVGSIEHVTTEVSKSLFEQTLKSYYGEMVACN